MDIRVGILGTGEIHSVHHAAMSELDTFIITDVYDPTSSAYLNDCTVNNHDSLDSFFKSGTFDVCIISSPSDKHYDATVLAMDLEIPVICEKPLCITPDQLCSLTLKRKENNGFLYTALHAAFGSEVRLWKKFKDRHADDLGSLLSIESYFYDPYLHLGKLEEKRESLHDSWVDSGVNALSVWAEFIDINNISLESTTVPNETNSPNRQIKYYKLDNSPGLSTSFVSTDWTVPINKKLSFLKYSNGVVLLDHSSEFVALTFNKRSQPVFYAEQRKYDRLTTQYINVFSNVNECLERQRDNFDLTKNIHQTLFQ